VDLFPPKRSKLFAKPFNIFAKVELSALFRSFASLLRAHYSQLMNTNHRVAPV